MSEYSVSEDGSLPDGERELTVTERDYFLTDEDGDDFSVSIYPVEVDRLFFGTVTVNCEVAELSVADARALWDFLGYRLKERDDG